MARITKQRKEELIARLDKVKPEILDAARELESTVPGITAAVASGLDTISADLCGDNPYEFSIVAQFDNLTSKIRNARQGLYSRVTGPVHLNPGKAWSWHYA